MVQTRSTALFSPVLLQANTEYWFTMDSTLYIGAATPRTGLEAFVLQSPLTPWMCRICASTCRWFLIGRVYKGLSWMLHAAPKRLTPEQGLLVMNFLLKYKEPCAVSISPHPTFFSAAKPSYDSPPNPTRSTAGHGFLACKMMDGIMKEKSCENLFPLIKGSAKNAGQGVLLCVQNA